MQSSAATLRDSVAISFAVKSDFLFKETGAIVRGDTLLLLYGLDVLERHGPGQKLIFDVKCSQALPEVFEAAGGEPIMWQTGHSLIKKNFILPFTNQVNCSFL